MVFTVVWSLANLKNSVLASNNLKKSIAESLSQSVQTSYGRRYSSIIKENPHLAVMDLDFTE
jgi:hypothetical protein